METVPKKMRLQIESNSKHSFTLIEVMVAIAVLSLGIVFIYSAFSGSLNVFTYSSRRLKALRWMDEKIWETQNELICSGTLITGGRAGSFVDGNKNFDWKMSVNLIDQAQDSYLYRLALIVFWKQPQRNVNLSQTAYVQN